MEQMQMQLGMLRACMGGSDARAAEARQALSTRMGVSVTPDHVENSRAMYVQWWRGQLRVSHSIPFSASTWRALRARARHFYRDRFLPLALDLLAVNEEARARFEQLSPPVSSTEPPSALLDHVPAFASPDGVVLLDGRLTLLEFKTIKMR